MHLSPLFSSKKIVLGPPRAGFFLSRFSRSPCAMPARSARRSAICAMSSPGHTGVLYFTYLLYMQPICLTAERCTVSLVHRTDLRLVPLLGCARFNQRAFFCLPGKYCTAKYLPDVLDRAYLLAKMKFPCDLRPGRANIKEFADEFIFPRTARCTFDDAPQRRRPAPDPH
jgi:hypothetical protein